ncbi:MAG TPA: aminotransferase class I/II-fold pyridoxal phosphate-dependent enzyme [Terriglobales bacterium]|nr:aminotransferase class I/II-fold pyridoxal phosphate-dependent enzyme [Terriglobales bacterium]
MNGHGGLVWDANGERALRLDFSASLWPERRVALPRTWRAWLEPYPDPECRALTRAASHYYGVPAQRILAVNGATEGLYLVLRHLRPRRLAVYTPSFSEYEVAARWAGSEATADILRIPTAPGNGFLPELRVPDAEVVVLGNPNNPTGTLLTRRQLTPWLDALDRAGIWALIDEAFIDFVPHARHASLLAVSTRWPRLIVLRSMTKRFGIAGVRLGFVMAAAEVVARLREEQIPWSVNSLAQRLGTDLARLTPDLDFAGRIATERAYLGRGLERLGFRVFPSAANFLLFQMPKKRSNCALLGRLRAQGLGLRDGSTFPGLDASFVRAAVRPRAEGRQLLEALSQAVARHIPLARSRWPLVGGLRPAAAGARSARGASKRPRLEPAGDRR